MATLLDTALYLCDKGLAVVPIVKGQKRPTIGEWQSHKRDRDDLQSIFENSNGTIGGIGVVTGHLSGNFCCVLDFDNEGWAGAFDYLTDCWPEMARTVTVRTGSGKRHLWIHIPDLPEDFTHEEFARPDLKAVIDLRGNRTQTVVPPSLHPSGNRYEWANDNSDFVSVPFAEIIRWLREWAGDKATRTGPTNGDGDLQPGMRHDYLLKVAGSLRRQGMTAVEMLPVLRSVNEERCKPPKSDEELVHIANSVQKYKPAAPPEPAEPGAAPAQKRPSTIPKSTDLIAFLGEHGYQFRMNECDDSLECNKQRMSDVLRAEVRAVLRDAGYRKHLLAAEDAYLAEAGRHKYHPVREYLDSLEWDGAAWIETLASYFTNAQGVFPVYLRKWLIGAVARAYEGCQECNAGVGRHAGNRQVTFRQVAVPHPWHVPRLGYQPGEQGSSDHPHLQVDMGSRGTDKHHSPGGRGRAQGIPEPGVGDGPATVWALRHCEAGACLFHRHRQQLIGLPVRPDRQPALLGLHAGGYRVGLHRVEQARRVGRGRRGLSQRRTMAVVSRRGTADTGHQRAIRDRRIPWRPSCRSASRSPSILPTG